MFRMQPEKATQRAQHPSSHGHLPDGRAYTIDGSGLHLEGREYTSLLGKNADGALRQALIPAAWDGRLAVHFIGGAGAYAASYADTLDDLLGRGMAVAWEDILGYGYSAGGHFGVLPDYRKMLNAQTAFHREIPSLLRKVPERLIILGFSYGGQIALEMVRHSPADGVIALAPLLRAGGPLATPFVVWLLRASCWIPFLNRIFFMRSRYRGLPLRQRYGSIYREAYFQQKEQDPFVDDSVHLPSLAQLLAVGEDLLHSPPPPCRVEVLHGDEDGTCDHDSSRRLVERWRSEGGNAEFTTLPGLPHQLLLLQEPHSQSVMAAVQRAIARIVSSTPA